MIGRRAYTTIDRSKPSTAITLKSGAKYSKTAQIPMQIDFADDVAGPFPANFLCFQFGGETNICDRGAGYIYGYNPNCSVPRAPAGRPRSSARADYGAGPDGRIWACVTAADASVPDNPDSADQGATAESGEPLGCEVRRARARPPAAERHVHGPDLREGRRLVTFRSTATDATSGIKVRGWTWGDAGAGHHRPDRQPQVHDARHLSGHAQGHRHGGPRDDGEEADHHHRRADQRPHHDTRAPAPISTAPGAAAT